MKKLIATATLAAIACVSSAQGITAYSQSKANATVDSYTLPRTIVTATITQEREVIIRGPYARYASQYLGIIGAPQTDKENFKILGASLSFIEEPDPQQTYVIDEKSSIPARVFHWLETTPIVLDVEPKDANYNGAKIGNQNPFTDMGATILSTPDDNTLTIDKSSAAAKSPDQMAAEAAATIFKLRKKRIELVCAEQGENVFGAGLKAALDEINKLEQKYLELFVGKRFTQIITKTFRVIPDPTKTRLVACRFSENKGLTNETDLAAAPVNLEFSLPVGENTTPNATRKAAGRTAPVRIPQIMQVKLSYADNVLDSERIPVYQFGSIIQAPII